ncbi:hypothetical protein ACFT7S_01405 [Streptomyces sp. NPDC057136]|uniref:hypothetical protein n=1 Tax=Streptomyces sp. NPDC057136 TaxID=3346029 RepID=UPI00363972A4
MSLLTLLAARPAQADAVLTIPVSVQLAALVSLSAPSSADLGSGTPGGSISTFLGPVTVNGNQQSDWTATVSATNFTTPPGDAHRTITTSRVSYWSGDSTETSGQGTFTPGQLAAGDAQTLDSPRTAFSRSGDLFANSATWNPHLVIAVPSTAVAGTYTGTVTHSVA